MWIVKSTEAHDARRLSSPNRFSDESASIVRTNVAAVRVQENSHQSARYLSSPWKKGGRLMDADMARVLYAPILRGARERFAAEIDDGDAFQEVIAA